MNELLKTLYDNFYEPMPETELKKEIEDCHQQLIETLDQVVTIQKEGAVSRRAAEQELGRIEGELKQKLLELRG